MTRVACLRTALILAGALLAQPLAAAGIILHGDGWYRWEVPAGHGGRDACCYEFRSGRLTGAVGCRLGHGENDLATAGDCDLTSDTMQIFLEVSGGRVRELRAFSSGCPVSVDADVRTIDGVSTADSIAWLLREVEENSRLAEEAIMTLSFHAEREALDALIGLVEDRGQRHDTREEALFWLVQTESDEAFAYLDRLLN